MQTRAIIEAALHVAAEGGDPRPEIMVPLVSHANELSRTRALIEETAAAAMAEAGRTVDVPRSAR